MKRFFEIKALFFALIAGLLLLGMFISPNEVMDASRGGLLLWYNSVLPSVFPFIVFANILVGLGVVNFFGVLLEPVMRPLFNVSGSAAFPLVFGMLSGYPVGAKITSDLYDKGGITKTEAERIFSFSNNSGPLFIIGAVGVGLFKNAYIGFFILFIHIAGALLNGILFRFYKGKEKKEKIKNKSIIKKAYRSFRKSNTNPSLGELLSDCIKNAMEISLTVGGFIILFSVIAEILTISGVIEKIALVLSSLLFFLDFDVCNAITVGILEVTNGVNSISATGASLFQQVTAACIIIGFGGFSIHAQIVSLLSKTNLNTYIFMLSKLSHSIISGVMCVLLFPLYKTTVLDKHIPTISTPAPQWGFLNTATVFAITIATIFLAVYNFKKNRH